MRRAQSWIFRLQQEYKLHDVAYFITLTYDNEHIPLTENGFMTLEKTHLMKFFKNLRNDKRKNKEAGKVRYYACGEYGGHTYRPHYHAIVFNCSTDAIDAAWRDSIGGARGSVHFGKVTSASTAYVTKYICKPGRLFSHGRDDRAKEFSLMSKGIGKNYLTDEIIKYHTDDLTRYFVTEPGGVKVSMPRYYRDRLYYPSDLDYIKAYLADKQQKDLAAKHADYIRIHGSLVGFIDSVNASRKFVLNNSFKKRIGL